MRIPMLKVRLLRDRRIFTMGIPILVRRHLCIKSPPCPDVCRVSHTICMIWLSHDDVIKWKHFLRYWPFVRRIHRSPVNSPHKGQWRGALMFSLICVWINDWINNGEAGDLRRYRIHYDVTVMQIENGATTNQAINQVQSLFSISFYLENGHHYCTTAFQSNKHTWSETQTHHSASQKISPIAL